MNANKMILSLLICFGFVFVFVTHGQAASQVALDLNAPIDLGQKVDLGGIKNIIPQSFSDVFRGIGNIGEIVSGKVSEVVGLKDMSGNPQMGIKDWWVKANVFLLNLKTKIENFIGMDLWSFLWIVIKKIGQGIVWIIQQVINLVKGLIS